MDLLRAEKRLVYLLHSTLHTVNSSGTMDDGMRCPVFCIADLPASTLNRFLECTEERMRGERVTGGVSDASQRVVIIDNKDLASITKGSSVPVEPFVSPFAGKSVEEVAVWFQEHIARPERTGYMHSCFVVLDKRSEEDETCVVVCTRGNSEDGGEDDGGKGREERKEEGLQWLRCDFYLGAQNAVVCEMGQGMAEGVMGSFMRSGALMTQESLKIAEDGGLYIEGGEVKLDQGWRDFLQW